MFKKMMALALMISLAPSVVYSFSDIANDSKNLEAIQFMEELDFFPGDNFQADTPLTRGELFEYVARLNNLEKTSFVEIEGISSELSPWIVRFRELGVRTRIGEEGFEEDKPLNRVTAFRMLMNFEGVFIPRQFDQAVFKNELPGVPAEAYYSHIIAKALDLGLLNIKEGETYNPLAQFTREDLAVMLAQMEIYKSRLLEAEGNLPKVILKGESSANLDFLTVEQNAILEDVWLKINTEYPDKDELEKEKLFYGMVQGLVDSVGDPFSVYLSPEGHNNFMQSLSDSLEGIGASLNENLAGEVEVISPLNGSPAAEAGLQPGDIIYMIDDKPCADESLYESINRIKGPAGTSVKLSVKRGQESLELNIVRAEINIPAMTYEITSDDVAVLSLNSFGDAAVDDFDKFIEEVNTEQLSGIILDLRNNPGGYVEAASHIADYFLEENEVILQVQAADSETQTVLATTKSTLGGIKTVVLLNEGSASASEILALALSENGYASIIGQQSYGKGTVQQITNYVDNSALKLTIAKWLSPDGNSIDKVGIEPDIFVDELTEDKDITMSEALSRFKS